MNVKGRVFLDFIIEASQRVAAGAMLRPWRKSLRETRKFSEASLSLPGPRVPIKSLFDHLEARGPWMLQVYPLMTADSAELSQELLTDPNGAKIRAVWDVFCPSGAKGKPASKCPKSRALLWAINLPTFCLS